MCTFDDCFIEKGYVCLYNNNAKQLNIIDDYLKKWIIDMGGSDCRIPALIDKKVLEKCGYFTTFPQHLTAAAFVKPEFYENVANENKVKKEYLDITDKYFTPAACLHIYPMLEGKDFTYKNEAITTLARVYRYEQDNFEELTRLWDFTVREFVFVGSEDYVLEKLEESKEKVLVFTNEIGLSTKIVEANDHFYPSKKNSVKIKLQKANALKSELTVQINNKDVAIASFNFHHTHFSKTFDFDKNGKIVTGCVGFGLERWMAALIENKIDLIKLSERVY